MTALGLLASLLLGFVLLGGHPRRHVSHSIVPAGTTQAGPQSVGMPIPTGTAPVRPVRILLDITQHPIPGRERIALANWIAQTQHPLTRLRIEDRGHLSAPLSGAAWSTASTVPLGAGNGIAWLRAGVRHHQAGALIHLGGQTPPHMLSTAVRESSAPVSRSILYVHHKLAAEIARQIMITSRQGYGGSTS